MKKCFFVIVSMLFVLNTLHVSTAAAAASSSSQAIIQEREINILKSNALINKFFEYYGESTNDGVQFPDYYAGFEIRNDGTLVLHSTSVGAETKELIYDICGTTDVDIEEAEYSFEQLFEAVNDLTKDVMHSNKIECAVISIPSNQVNIYISGECSNVKTDENAIADSGILSTFQYVSIDNAIKKAAYPGEERESKFGASYEDGSYHFYLTDVSSVDNDSGAPVYTKSSSSSFKLLGIVKGHDSGGTKVISVPTIKAAYPHYVYLNSSSYQ